MSNLMDDLLSGRALESDVDAYIDAWHDAPEGTPGIADELHTFLGLSWDEYKLFVASPRMLRVIAAAKRARRPVSAYLVDMSDYGLAARAAEPEEARRLVAWLVEQGKLPPE